MSTTSHSDTPYSSPCSAPSSVTALHRPLLNRASSLIAFRLVDACWGKTLNCFPRRLAELLVRCIAGGRGSGRPPRGVESCRLCQRLPLRRPRRGVPVGHADAQPDPQPACRQSLGSTALNLWELHRLYVTHEVAGVRVYRARLVCRITSSSCQRAPRSTHHVSWSLSIADCCAELLEAKLVRCTFCVSHVLRCRGCLQFNGLGRTVQQLSCFATT